jgi:TetR/AcrR family transcriptional regulator, cholesterol catabolism regulator
MVSKLRRRASPPAAAMSVEDRSVRREILNAAAKLLRSNGYRATTLREIASAVGIKAGSIYYHFRSKDEIVAAVMNDGVDRVFDAVSSALNALSSDASPLDRLFAAVSAHLHALLEYSDYTSAGLKAFSDAPEAVRRAARPHRRRYEAIWSGLVSELERANQIPRGISAEAMRFALLGLMNWSPEWYRPGKHSIENFARQFCALVVRD